ncbi:MAG TPA: heme-degrading domain-containing protein [Lachnospiraceae bacterium]|nr:heme-degrading domain-containing protein [Lachnospiraceae bacterium]
MSEEKDKKLDEVMKLLELQEEILQFTHFTNADAWELGNLIVAEAKKRELSVAVSIKLNSGMTVFQHLLDGRNLNNERWITRKFNTVREMETSSLYLYTKLEKTERTMADIYMDESEYANSGGGFPIRVEDVGVIGAIIVSGLNHVADHDLIIKCLSKYLHTDEVPRIRDAY